MKKIFLMVVFSAVISFYAVQNSVAQINYETTYYFSAMRMIYLTHAGPKWIAPANNGFNLYNIDHSLYRYIPVATQPVQTGSAFVTEDLFDNDSTNIEFLISAIPTSTQQFVKIYREDGALLFQRDSAYIPFGSVSSNIENYSNVFPTDSGTKLVLQFYAPYKSEIYSLPGKLPCPITCGGVSSAELANMDVQKISNPNSHLPFPNPSSTQTHIPYSLPDGETQGEIIFYDAMGTEVKRFKVDRTFSDLVLTAGDLSAGSYYYHLVTTHSKSEGKKLVVIK
jgi:hypothetical protein